MSVLTCLLFDGLCSGLLLKLVHPLAKALFLDLLGSCGLAVESLDLEDVDAADSSLYFLLDRNIVEDLLFADK